MAKIDLSKNKNKYEKKELGILKGLNIEVNVSDIKTLDQATDFIKKNDKQVAAAWFNLSHALKKVRDEKLYEEKYESFQEYFENELNYKKTMVYNFIKIAENYPLDTKEDIIELGVRKLIALAEVSEEERTSYIENTDIENKSSEEIKEELKQLNSEREQENNNTNTTVSSSTDNREIAAVNRFYNKLDRLYTTFEKYREKRKTSTPVFREEIVEIEKTLVSFEREVEKMRDIIDKYLK